MRTIAKPKCQWCGAKMKRTTSHSPDGPSIRFSICPECGATGPRKILIRRVEPPQLSFGPGQIFSDVITKHFLTPPEPGPLFKLKKLTFPVPEYTLHANIKAEFPPLPHDEDTMPKKLHDKLKKEASKKGYKGEKAKKYVYGTLNKFKKKRQKK